VLVKLTQFLGFNLHILQTSYTLNPEKCFERTKYHVTNRQSLLQHTLLRTNRKDVCIT